jgi:hypothetical protein
MNHLRQVALLYAATLCAASVITVFTDSEMKHCQRIRSPSLFASGPASSPTIHLLARCCGANLCSGKPQSGVSGSVGDNNKDASVIFKSTSDFGTTWSASQQLSPNPDGTLGFSSAFGFMRDNKTAVVQFIQVGDTSPAKNVRYWQITSDDMKTWSAPEEVTAQLSHCSPLGSSNMMVPSDGSKSYTNTRFMNPMHDHGGNGIVAFTDDGGLTWNCSNKFVANEISVAPNARKGSQDVYMNGRGSAGNFAPNRAEYRSSSNGATWVGPTKSALIGDHGCERSLRADVYGRLISCEPTAKKRSDMKCECSTDAGVTWPYSVEISDNAENDHSGYNDIWISGDQVVMVMEDNKDGNMYSARFTTDFCGK